MRTPFFGSCLTWSTSKFNYRKCTWQPLHHRGFLSFSMLCMELFSAMYVHWKCWNLGRILSLHWNTKLLKVHYGNMFDWWLLILKGISFLLHSMSKMLNLEAEKLFWDVLTDLAILSCANFSALNTSSIKLIQSQWYGGWNV